MSSEYKFSAYFKLYSPDGVQVTFGVADNDGHEQLTALAGYMTDLARLGYLAQMPGLEDGEKIEECDAYVVGETSKGDGCIYVYSASHQLQYRLATVYVERFGDLPFDVKGKKWDASAAPTREEAEKKGYLVTVPAFKIVMEQRGVTDDGKPQWRFNRVHGAAPKPQPSPAPAGSEPTKADKELDAIPGAQDTTPCTEAQRKQIVKLAKGRFTSNEQYIGWLKTNFATGHLDKLTIRQADEAISALSE